MVGGGEEAWHRFPYLPGRDGQSTLAFGGFRTDETALIAGQALAGVVGSSFDAAAVGTRSTLDVDTTWSLSPKTKLGTRYDRDLQYSVFSTSGTPPTVYATAEVFLDKVLTRSVSFA